MYGVVHIHRLETYTDTSKGYAPLVLPYNYIYTTKQCMYMLM